MLNIEKREIVDKSFLALMNIEIHLHKSKHYDYR